MIWVTILREIFEGDFGRRFGGGGISGEDEMEENMEQVSAMIGNLRNMANDMGNDFGGDFRGRFWEEILGGDFGRRF